MASTNYSQSKLKQFRRCQKLYSFRYDYPRYFGRTGNYEMVPKTKRLPLFRGTWMHALQEALHKQWAGLEEFTITVGEGKKSLSVVCSDWRELHEALTRQFETMFDEEKEEYGDLPTECERLFRAYLRFWKDDQDLYEVAEIGGKPAVEYKVDVPFPKAWKIEGRFKGTIDLIVRDAEYEGLWIWDAKWVRSVPYPDERMMSPQALLYRWAVEKQLDEPVRGFVFNYGRTKPPTWPDTLKKGVLTTKRSLDSDQYTYLLAIKELHGENWKKFLPYYREKLLELKGKENQWFRRERIPVEDERVMLAVKELVTTVRDIQRREKRREYIPRSYFYNCKFFCEYHDLCVAEFQGLDIEPLVKANFAMVGERYFDPDLLAA